MWNLFKGMTIIIILLSFISCGKKVEEVHGKNGSDGESCYADIIDGVKTITCGDSSFTVSDGIDGSDGQNGSDGQDGVDGSFDGYLEYRTVCESIPGQYQETLLYLDGEYLAFLSSSNYKKQRTVILKENTLYKTTDGRNVYFTIINGEIDCSSNI